MTEQKLTVREIIEISKAMNTMEELKIAFSDFSFNLGLGKLKGDAKAITDPHDQAYAATFAAKRAANEPFERDEVDKMLNKKHAIEIPEITEDLLKKTGVPLPVSVISVLGRYITENGKKK